MIMTTPLTNAQKHGKLIHLPVKLVRELEDLAKKDNRDLKNYIETQLIAIVEASKSKK